MKLFGPTHPIQVEDLLADNGVLEEYFVELAKLEKEDLFKVVHFELPVLCHRRRKVFPAEVWDEERCWVVVRVIGSVVMLVPDICRFEKLWE